MTSDDKMRITYKKAKQEEITCDSLNRVVSSEERQNVNDRSDETFLLQEQVYSGSKYGKLVLSRGNISKSTDGDQINQTTPLGKSSEDFLKIEVVKSIIDAMLSRIDDRSQSLASGDYLKSFCIFKSPIDDISPLDVQDTKVDISLTIKSKPKNVNLENRKQRINSLVKEFELPVNLSQIKQVESRPKLERLVIDTLVTTSSTIISKAEESMLGSESTSGPPVSSDTETTGGTATGGGGGGGGGGLGSEIDSPFHLCWCFGFNTEVPVINLSNEASSQILFANSQYAVIYDFHEEAMSFLQGHLNTVSCIAANPTGSLLVTADSSSNAGTSRVIVWDRRPCVLYVLDDVHPHGCQQVGLSANGEFLVTVSANQSPVSIKVWEFERDTKYPSSSTVIKESLGSVKKLTTHPTSRYVFAVTFDRSVVFTRVVWQTVFQEIPGEGKVSEKIKDCEFGNSVLTPSKIGALTDTTFTEDSDTIAFTSTCKGYVIVWEDNVNSRHKKIFKKYVRLHLNCITNIEIVDNMIAVATVSGNVSFYDLELKVLFFHKLHEEPLVSLSFNIATKHSNAITCETHSSCANIWKRECKKLVDASLKSERILVRHYIVSTESGRIAYVNASCGTPKYLSFPAKDMFTAQDMMPGSKYLCAGTASGNCILIDTDSRKVKVTKQIKVQANVCQAISFLKYSPAGFCLACAMYTGEIWLLDPILLSPIIEYPLDDCSCCVTHIVFTPSSDYMIVADVSFCVSAYYLGEKPTLICQYISHFKHIVKVQALTSNSEWGDRKVKIASLSADRTLCIYIIDRNKKTFEFLSSYRVEQTAIPMYSVPYPFANQEAYLGVSSEHKFRLVDNPTIVTTNSTVVKRCRETFQAPNFGTPINYLEIFENNGKPYLFFKTKYHIGLHILPIDGNPYRALGFRASPTDLTCCSIDPEGKFVYTISESFGGISMWKINTEAVEDFYRSGGEGLVPFLKVVGKEKENQIRDYFDLGQFIHQGESPSLVRTLKNSLPLCEIANVLQALGCLLTRQDVNELTTAMLYTDPENPTLNIEYEDFVRLYVNYRESEDLKLSDLRQAFQVFYAGVYFGSESPENVQKYDSNAAFDSSAFMHKLISIGEEMTHEELYTDLSILTGGLPEHPEDENSLFQVPPTMPEEITFDTFVKDILGFAVRD